MKGKNGQTGGVLNITVVVILALVVLAVGFYFVEEILTQDNLYSQQKVANETGVYANGSTAYSTTYADSTERTRNYVVTEAWSTNSTVSYLIPFNSSFLAYLSIDDNGVLTNTTAVNVTRFANLSISYTFDRGQEGWEGVDETMDSFLEIPDLIGLLILVLLIAIVIAVILGWNGKTGTGA